MVTPPAAAAAKDDAGKPKPAPSLADIVPTVYYDLIARVCPGAAFWITLSLVSPEVQRVFSVEKIGGTSLVLLILLSYLAGIVLSGFCLVWDAISYRLLSAPGWLSSPLGLRSSHGLARQWQLVAQKMEAIAKASHDPGRIVTKALAEVTLCQNLLTGLVVLGAIGLYSSGRHFFSPATYPGTFGVVFVAFLVSMLFRQAMFLGRTEALYEMHVLGKSA
ncbi:hypothetical protein V4F39_15580 [Aquincola sp. MAHUQ-54]|uniref:Uncharacterized protein n=1 Tax=Aquincola agrisoli TaxID=3119538 RepID=A0AAW9Q7S9_9BURK